METLVANVPGMVYQCRNEKGWPILEVKGGATELTGYGPEEIVSQSEFFGDTMIHPDDRKDVWDTIQTALRDGATYEVTYRIVTKSGEVKRSGSWTRCGRRGGAIFSPRGNYHECRVASSLANCDRPHRHFPDFRSKPDLVRSWQTGRLASRVSRHAPANHHPRARRPQTGGAHWE